MHNLGEMGPREHQKSVNQTRNETTHSWGAEQGHEHQQGDIQTRDETMHTLRVERGHKNGESRYRLSELVSGEMAMPVEGLTGQEVGWVGHK